MTAKQYNLSKLRGRVIAIDGPAGSGKSTTARILAARLGYRYLDTGAMYRALTWLALHNGIAPFEGEKLRVLAEIVSIEFETHEDVNKVFINGQEVTDQIRTPVITATVSEVSAHPGVRAAMVKKQQEMGKQGSIVAEGRDTTTTVFPKADVKVYLDADVETRAQRRLIDLVKMGVTTSLDELVADIQRRDAYDSGRKHSPLQKARDAYAVDTTHLTIDEQIERILALMKSVMK